VPGSSAEGDILYRNSTVWTRLPRGTDGQVLTATSSTVAWATPAAAGDVTGPESSTEHALMRFADTSGKVAVNSNVTLGNSGTALVFSGAAGLTAGGSNENVTLTPSGTGVVQAGVRLRQNGTAPTFLITDSSASGSSATAYIDFYDSVAERAFFGLWAGASNAAFLFGSSSGMLWDFNSTGMSSVDMRGNTGGSLDLKQLNVGGGTLGGGTTVDRILSASASLNFDEIAGGAEATLTITVTGAATTNTPSVSLGFSAALADGLVVKQAWVSGADTVSVRLANVSGSPIDPDAVTVRATVVSF
jgi:hypothetical protein